MAAGSYLRFAIGFLLSAEVIREWFFGNGFSYLSLLLAIIFIILSLGWFAFRF